MSLGGPLGTVDRDSHKCEFYTNVKSRHVNTFLHHPGVLSTVLFGRSIASSIVMARRGFKFTVVSTTTISHHTTNTQKYEKAEPPVSLKKRKGGTSDKHSWTTRRTQTLRCLLLQSKRLARPPSSCMHAAAAATTPLAPHMRPFVPCRCVGLVEKDPPSKPICSMLGQQCIATTRPRRTLVVG